MMTNLWYIRNVHCGTPLRTNMGDIMLFGFKADAWRHIKDHLDVAHWEPAEFRR